MNTKYLEKFIAAGVLAVLAVTAASCVNAGDTYGSSTAAPAAAPATKSASAQVKTLCDSATAKANAGDTAGAKRDIDFAIANAARVKLDLFIPIYYKPSEVGIYWMLRDRIQNDPQTQMGANTAIAAIENLQNGNIDAAKRQLDSLYYRSYKSTGILIGAADAYVIMGDFKKANEAVSYLESWNYKYGYLEAAGIKASMGDFNGARSDCAKALECVKRETDGYAIADGYIDVAKTQVVIGDFSGANSSMTWAEGAMSSTGRNDDYYLSRMLQSIPKEMQRFAQNPTMCWSNPNNPRRVALAQISKARCALAVAQAKAGDMGGAKNTLYFINDEQDRIATERAIASAGESFLQSGNVAKGIDTLVVIPPASQATAEQVRQSTKTWIDIKNNKLEGILAKMSEKDKNALLDKLELAILDCTTQSNSAKNMAASAAQTNSGSAFSLAELSDNYLNLQNVLKAVYKTVKEE